MIKDITESSGWAKHVVDGGFFADIRNIVLCLCSDGMNPFRKSTHSIWPIMASILNLPPHLRTKSEAMLLLGVVPGPKAPKNINLYLQCLSHELAAYGETGFWVYDAFVDEDFELRFKVIRLVADYPGSSKILCLKGSGAIHGCHHCHVEGSKDGLEATVYGNYRLWLPDNHAWRERGVFPTRELRLAPRTRTSREIRLFAMAAREAVARFGIKQGSVHHPSEGGAVTGWCALLDDRSFDPVAMFGPDLMHILVCLACCVVLCS